MWTGRTTQSKERSDHMTANQRRPGFRLPWAPDSDETTSREGESATAADASSPAAASDGSVETAVTADATSAPTEPAAAAIEAEAVTPEATADAEAVKPEAVKPEAASDEPAAAETTAARPPSASVAPDSDEFMRDLVAAMRRVADEARQNGMADLQARADEQVRKLEADAEKRREELRSRAEADVAGVGEWAQAEAERIKSEAEQRVVARRAQLDQQLAGDQARTEADTKALRDRVAEYERELEAYHAQLAEIGDPAAFAAAAKRMPQPPTLSGLASSTTAPAVTSSAAVTPAPAAPAVAADTNGEAEARVEPATGASNGVPASAPTIHPAEEEVLAARLAELDAKVADKGATPAAASTADAATTEVVVKGLGSFGAITGFRQSLAGVDGIDGVALSLGQTGEFVFRATHAAGFDLRAAIATLEGDGAKIEDRAEGGLRVTLDRAR
jgi:hypothetical protein